MQIKILDTIEDTHHFLTELDSGKSEMIYVTDVFKKDQTLECADDDYDTLRRFRKLIKMGHAEEVASQPLMGPTE